MNVFTIKYMALEDKEVHILSIPNQSYPLVWRTQDSKEKELDKEPQDLGGNISFATS